MQARFKRSVVLFARLLLLFDVFTHALYTPVTSLMTLGFSCDYKSHKLCLYAQVHQGTRVRLIIIYHKTFINAILDNYYHMRSFRAIRCDGRISCRAVFFLTK